MELTIFWKEERWELLILAPKLIIQDQKGGGSVSSKGDAYIKISNFDCDNKDRSIEIFTDENWDFFHDHSEKGGANLDISLLYNIVDQNYGNYIRNLFIRKCNYFRF